MDTETLPATGATLTPPSTLDLEHLQTRWPVKGAFRYVNCPVSS